MHTMNFTLSEFHREVACYGELQDIVAERGMRINRKNTR